MPETAPHTPNTQQPQPLVEPALIHESAENVRGLMSWDFGGVPDVEPISSQPQDEPERAPILARQKVKLATGIGRLASIGRSDNAPHAARTSEQLWPDRSWEYKAPEIVELYKSQVEGIEYFSNLPEGMFPFMPIEENSILSHPAEQPLLPSAIDALPAGKYYVAQASSRTPGTADTNFDRKIIVTDEPDGKRINEINKYTLIKNSGKSEALMTALGYQFEERVLDAGLPSQVTRYGELKAVPTPETLRQKAADLGVIVRFIPDQGIIDNRTYLKAFADETFPISTADALNYGHDTQDDHITAMVLGGLPLRSALRSAAISALKRNDLDDVVAGIDTFTSLLRETVAQTNNKTSNISGTPEILRQYGRYIDVPSSTVDEILETAQKNARKYGMDVTEYPEED